MEEEATFSATFLGNKNWGDGRKGRQNSRAIPRSESFPLKLSQTSYIVKFVLFGANIFLPKADYIHESFILSNYIENI